MAVPNILTRAQIITAARAELHEPKDGRYYKDDPEMYLWLNLALDEVSANVEFEKKPLSFLGNDATYYLSALGTKPRYYKMPSDFMMLDPEFGIKFDGIRRLGTSDQEVDAFQEKGLSQAADGSTIYIDDYFTETYNGVIIHYAVNMVINDADYGDGVVFWFAPNPSDATAISLRYIPLPAWYTGGTDKAKLMRQFNELLIFGLIKRAIRKKYNDGLVTFKSVELYENLYDRMERKAIEFLKTKKTPDKIRKIKSAKQVYNMYNSARSGRGNIGTSIE